MQSYLSFLQILTPSFSYPQGDICNFMLGNSPDDKWIRRSLTSVYQNSGIENRYSVLEDFNEGQGDFFNNKEIPTTSSRMNTYAIEARKLGLELVKMVEEKMTQCHSSLKEITHLVWVSCTGQTAPGMETVMVHNFRFSDQIQATAFNFLGCHGFFHGLRFAKSVVESNPKAKVLVMCVELCTLHFQPKWDIDHILANGIFGDGAASIVVSAEKLEKNSIEIKNQSQSYFHFAAEDMAWSLGETGFEMKLSQELPQSVESSIQHALDQLFKSSGLNNESIQHWILHPGGKRILDKVQEVLSLHPGQLKYSRKALETVGNVSSASVLFALQHFLSQNPNPKGEQGVLLGIGPGLSIESAQFVY